MYITFGQSTAATGYQLSDQLLLRVDPKTQNVAGLTIFNFSVHASASRKLPLPGLDDDPDSKALLMDLLTTPPVNHFLMNNLAGRQSWNGTGGATVDLSTP